MTNVRLWDENGSVHHLFWGQRRSMAARGGCCTPLERCFRKWGRRRLWLSPASHTFLRKRVGGLHRLNLPPPLRVRSKVFELHQFAEPSHTTLMNDESRLRKAAANTKQSGSP